MVKHRGGCHCSRIQFEVEAKEDLEAYECNCSICKMLGFLHVIVPKENFQLLQGENDLTTYEFGTHTAKHYFCKVCGVKSFYIPRSNPNGYSVNARCLEKTHIQSIKIYSFDGQNWEENASKLSHLTHTKKET